ncbi:P-loop containing nucleoside triphosphate hydrolase protein [Protomyces lactucae-debilis]|uniref:p-loop containing nucleoside triphosphate hydrolase protein n=1 Tax=Protomyces lactucae-debilis TaxID=2754530 RepID=A0A1Y2FAH6_PROLT|nr:P-loop containing nucleoside triphosphate hydrolase protein [Protomyces lactucae-debilis]ORY80346.1 P-loop containing nucleoside triphosphate hydrolase protein [Protomyces lactucae-debilis]
MDDDLYDEFGNYIGADDSDEDGSANLQAAPAARITNGAQMESMQVDGEVEEEAEPQNQIILHEDKQYYPSAAQIYGEDVEVMVQEEDAQPLTEPIVKPVRQKRFTVEQDDLPEVVFDRSLMLQSMAFPDFVRNVAVVGHLHHGKTALMDMLVYQTHPEVEEPKKDQQLRFTDMHALERDRGMSIKATPITLMLPNTKGKSLVCNFIDTPGHVNFIDEVAASIRLADGIVLVVDAAEGFMPDMNRVLQYAVSEGVSLTLVINKVDRLILELKLPPADAYYKLKHVIEEVNCGIASFDSSDRLRLSPERGNVCFASASMNWCFSLRSFAKFYADTFEGIMLDQFTQRLWGDIYFDPASHKFTKKAAPGASRSFVHFVLEPIYKLYSSALSEDASVLRHTLADLHIVLRPAAYKMNARPLLKLICREFFGPATGLVDMLFEHVASPADNAARKVENHYTGPQDTVLAKCMKSGDAQGPLVIHITKLISAASAESFSALGRIYSGTATRGQTVRVLGEAYAPDDEEDMAFAKISSIVVPGARYRFGVEEMGPGCLVLIDGIDKSISKTATIVSKDHDEECHIFRPIQHMTESTMKLAVEPINPAELPRMLDGLRKINKSYPLAVTKVEESGEHVILGTGELYMDSIMHDLRKLYSEIDIKVSDPVVRFCETVIDTSAIKCYADTPNRKNRITMIAEPLDDSIAQDIERGQVDIRWPASKLGKHFEERYHWDVLASRSVWAFGPEENGPNILQNDTLPTEVDKKLLFSVKEHLKQGFQWATREGPLCDESIRDARFKILDVSLASEALYRGGGQMIPTARRVCYASMLTANPRLMEPVNQAMITAPADCIPAIYNVLANRRGHVTREGPLAGTPLYTLSALLPVIDSFGFETDLRSHTLGQAFCQQIFDHWQVVPGDPLDQTVKLRPLQAAAPQDMARDFMIKTRKRKGLNAQVSVRKYIDEEMAELLLKNEVLDAALL